MVIRKILKHNSQIISPKSLSIKFRATFFNIQKGPAGRTPQSWTEYHKQYERGNKWNRCVIWKEDIIYDNLDSILIPKLWLINNNKEFKHATFNVIEFVTTYFCQYNIWLIRQINDCISASDFVCFKLILSKCLNLQFF